MPLLNRPVLLIADLARAERLSTASSAWGSPPKEPRANAPFLRLPRSGNHHDPACSASAPKRRGGIGLYHLTGSTRFDELAEARYVLANAGRTRR